MANYNRIPLRDRFEEKYVPEPNSGCWLWIAKAGSNGYGQIHSGGTPGRYLLAHRVAYELYKGPIPEGLQVLHRCDTHGCVNPDHLFVGDQTQNMRDMLEKGRQKTGLLPLGVRELSRKAYPGAKKRYCAAITYRKKRHVTRYFETIAEAQVAYAELRAAVHEES